MKALVEKILIKHYFYLSEAVVKIRLDFSRYYRIRLGVLRSTLLFLQRILMIPSSFALASLNTFF